MFKSRSLIAAVALVSSPVFAQGESAFSFLVPESATLDAYDVVITNLTPGQTFTPQLLVSHTADISLFEIGEPASMELEILAEGGNTGPLTDAVVNVVSDVQTVDGLLEPGRTVSWTIDAYSDDVVSMAAMLIPTNDTFVAMNGMSLPEEGSVTYYVKAYDAGTEENDQNCRNIPGPRCGGEGYNGEIAEGDEGFVHVSNGFHRLNGNTLSPATYDWRNPVARITVTLR
ncbi:MAG: spondin domain-containing protein [Halioglobus sp.]